MNLAEWYTQMHIQEKARSHFIEVLTAYKEECPGEYSSILQDASSSEISTHLTSFSKNVEPKYSIDAVEVVFDIFHRGKTVGWYKELFDINGNSLDDFLVIE